MAFMFGAGRLQISATAGAFNVARLQNISLNITWETAQLRGGVTQFAINTQFFDGAAEGSFEHGEVELSQIGRLLADSFAGAGGSGTMTVSGQSVPVRFSLVMSGVTNGVTSTVTIDRVYIPSLTLDFTRTDYMIPAMNFIAEADPTAGGLLTWQM